VPREEKEINDYARSHFEYKIRSPGTSFDVPALNLVHRPKCSWRALIPVPLLGFEDLDYKLASVSDSPFLTYCLCSVRSTASVEPFMTRPVRVTGVATNAYEMGNYPLGPWVFMDTHGFFRYTYGLSLWTVPNGRGQLSQGGKRLITPAHLGCAKPGPCGRE